MKWAVISLAFVAMMAVDASACGGCGSYSHCKFVRNYSHSYRPKVVIQKQAYPSYVPPNQQFIFVNPGTAPQILSQGQTYYGQPSYQQAIQPYKTSSADQLHLANRLVGTIESLSTQASQSLKSEVEVNRLLGASQALSTTIHAAREHTAALSASQSFVVTVGANGEVQMKTLTAQQQGQVGRQHVTQQPADAPQTAGILSLKCGSCHGADKTAPPGGLFVHDTATFNGGFSDRISDLLDNPAVISDAGMRSVFENMSEGDGDSLVGAAKRRENK